MNSDSQHNDNRGPLQGRSVRVLFVLAGVLLLIGGFGLAPAAPSPVDELGWLSLALTVVVASALIGGHLAGRVGQAAVLGELLAGMLLGMLTSPLKLQFIATDPYLDMLARIGMLLLLFEVGLDLSIRDLFVVGPSSLLVAIVGTAASLLIGTGAATLTLPTASAASHMFVGAALTATSAAPKRASCSALPWWTMYWDSSCSGSRSQCSPRHLARLAPARHRSRGSS
jgi:Na+:H+ antiporter